MAYAQKIDISNTSSSVTSAATRRGRLLSNNSSHRTSSLGNTVHISPSRERRISPPDLSTVPGETPHAGRSMATTTSAWGRSNASRTDRTVYSHLRFSSRLKANPWPIDTASVTAVSKSTPATTKALIWLSMCRGRPMSGLLPLPGKPPPRQTFQQERRQQGPFGR